MNGPRQYLAIGAAALIAAWIIAKLHQSTSTDPPRVYSDLGMRDAINKRLATKVSPDPYPVYSHHVAQPHELDDVIWGAHPLHAHVTSMSPACHKVQTQGWDWIMSPPSEVSI
jgi:hypothetical protein